MTVTVAPACPARVFPEAGETESQAPPEVVVGGGGPVESALAAVGDHEGLGGGRGTSGCQLEGQRGGRQGRWPG